MQQTIEAMQLKGMNNLIWKTVLIEQKLEKVSLYFLIGMCNGIIPRLFLRNSTTWRQAVPLKVLVDVI